MYTYLRIRIIFEFEFKLKLKYESNLKFRFIPPFIGIIFEFEPETEFGIFL